MTAPKISPEDWRRIGRALGKWRNQVRAKQLPGGAWLKMAQEIAEYIDAAEFIKTGQLVTLNRSTPRLAAGAGLSRRMAHYATKQLRSAGCIEVLSGRGRGYFSRYLLVDEKVQPVAPFNEKKVQSISRKGATHFPEKVQPIAHSTSVLTSVLTLPTTAKTGTSGPPRLDGVGPLHGEQEASKGPGKVQELGKLKPELEDRLGDRFWMIDAVMVLPSDDPATFRLRVMNPYQAANLTDHCEADILAITGASKLEIVTVNGAGAFGARRST